MQLFVLTRSIFLILFLITSSSTLRVAPTSPCLSVCGDATLTNGSDIVCNDADFANTATGRAFQDCISCELNSTTYDSASGETDLQWLLYNLRYELSWCVWGFPNASGIGNTPCVTSFACGVFQDSIEVDDLSPSTSTFDYCTGFNMEDVEECYNCLEELDSELYLANFFTVLKAGCSQKPFNGAVLSLSGNLFSTNPISIVNSSTTISIFNTLKSGGLSLGGKVGIAVAGIVLILISTGCFIVCRGKRRRRAFLATQNRRNQNMLQHSGSMRPIVGGAIQPTTSDRNPNPNQNQRKNTPSPPTPPPSLQTQNFEWQRPDKYPISSPDETGSVTGHEKFFPSYYSSPVTASTEGPGSAVMMNQEHPWVSGGLGSGEGSHEGMMGRMPMVREGTGDGDDIELQRMEPRGVDGGWGVGVDLDFGKEVGKRGLTMGSAAKYSFAASPGGHDITN